MKSKILIICLMVSMSSCAIYHKHFGERSTMFSRSEQKILEDTTKALRFGFGYDEKLHIDYIYPYKGSIKNIRSNENKFRSKMADINIRSLVPFYEKIYKVRFKTIVLKNNYSINEKWINYTYINKYLLPGIEKYSELLERYLLSRDASYRNTIAQMKKHVEAETIRELQDIERKKKIVAQNKKIRNRKQ